MKAPLEFRIHGMDCADEVAILRREIVPLVGSPDRLAFDILRGKMLIASGAPVITADQIVRAVGRTGMRAEPWQDVQPGAAETGFWQRRGRTRPDRAQRHLPLAGFLAHVADAGLRAALGSEGVGLAAQVPLLALILYVTGIVAGGWFIAPRAWMAVRRLRPDMNLLMTIAVFGAVAIGEWFEAAVVTFLFALSLALESWSIGRARRAVEALLSIAPPTAHVLRYGWDESRGQRRRCDSRRPCAGQTRRAHTARRRGSPRPVSREPGADHRREPSRREGRRVRSVRRHDQWRWRAGDRSDPSGGRDDARADHPDGRRGANPTRTIRAMGRSLRSGLYAGDPGRRGRRLPTLPPLLRWRRLRRLVLPRARAARHRVSVRARDLHARQHRREPGRGGPQRRAGEGRHVHRSAGRLRAVALDKTGTLTQGTPQVVDVVAMDGHTEDELLTSMGALEAHSDHPLARAIVAHVRERGVTITAG